MLQWSRLSDRIGRKPVILVGLAGLCVSMFCFGLSTTFWGLVLRCVIFVLGWDRAHGGTAAVRAKRTGYWIPIPLAVPQAGPVDPVL